MSDLVYKVGLVAPAFGSGFVQTRVAQITLTAAQIQALHTTPVNVVPSPGTNKAVVFRDLYFQFKVGGTQFTGGGAITPVYHGATTDLSGTGGVAAAVVTGAVNDVKYVPGIAEIDITASTGIDLMAATANFAAGNGKAVVNLRYDAITLQ